MPHLLRIDASARFDCSHSRNLGDLVEARWRAAHPGGTVARRDLAAEPAPQITAATVDGFYADPATMSFSQRQSVRLSDQLIEELQQADTLLIAAPIYNFGVPAALKAWIDQVTRIGKTFAYEDGAFQGLVRADHAILSLAYGARGYLNSGPFKDADFLDPYLTFLLGFLGVERVDTLAVEGTTGDPADIADGLAFATQSLADIIPNVAA